MKVVVDMNHPADRNRQQIKQLHMRIEQLIVERDLLHPDDEDRLALDALIKKRQDQLTALQGHVDVSGSVRGPVIGVNIGVVQAFYGTQTLVDAKQLLDHYLHTLLEQYSTLRLGRLLEDERNSRDQTNAPALSLHQVYTSMATNATVIGERIDLQIDEAIRLVEQGNPQEVLPEHVRVFSRPDVQLGTQKPFLGARNKLAIQWQESRKVIGSFREEELLREPGYVATCWLRPELAVETVATQRRLVLLGDPGSGKSTLLQYLTIALAQALLDGQTTDLNLPAWQGKVLPVPIFCPLGQIAKTFDDDPDKDYTTLIQAILNIVQGEVVRTDLGPAMLQAWRDGSVILLLDGLDEVSGGEELTQAGPHSRRERMADAVRKLAEQIGTATIVVTCRTKPYEQEAMWQLREGWIVRRLEPFMLGQVRHFVRAWYHEASRAAEPRYPLSEASERAEQLIAAIAGQPRLTEIAASPLLLTMLTLLHYNKKELPNDRADAYEALVKLLMERWEGVRSIRHGQRRQNIGKHLGLPHVTTEHLRIPLHEIAFQAHQQAVDGRGVVSKAIVRAILDPFFACMIEPAQPDRVSRSVSSAKTEAFLEVLCEETGLLQAEDDETYVFPHLTFQEYLAACYLAALNKHMEMYTLWCTQQDRWREPLLLLMRRLVIQEKLPLAQSWLTLLLQARCGELPKADDQQQRDGILAAGCYEALGRGQTLGSGGYDVLAFETNLRSRLLEILHHPDPAIHLSQRVEAGTALGVLADPRYPVSVGEWCAHIERRNECFGEPNGYWCFVRAGTYQVGGWSNGSVSASITLPSFWIARFPITVAQFAPFVKKGYTNGAKRWWTPLGWQWRQEQMRIEPWGWQDERYNHPNQPVIAVTWYEAAAWAVWLTEQLADVLPPGYEVRLPTEAEWEAAAAYDGEMQRSAYPWGKDESSIERAVYDAATLQQPAPVGCCIAGKAACGALDLAGNVWEWTTSDYHKHPKGSAVVQKEFTHNSLPALRGGSYFNDSTYVRCGARDRHPPGSEVDLVGFRVILVSQLSQ